MKPALSLTPLRPVHAALLVIGAGLLARIWLIGRPIDVLVARYAADDFFYYLQVAWHIAQGQGSTFDGGVSHTNGFQPLFMAFLVPPFWLGLGKLAAIRWGLLVQALAVAGAGWAAFRILEREGRPWSGVLGAGLFSLNLFFLLPTLTGFEMALALAATLLAVRAWQTERHPALVGLVCGLAVLARVDGLILGGWIGLAYLLRRDGRSAAWFSAGVALAVAPWALWSLSEFGTVALDSGTVKSHLRSLGDAGLALRVAWGALPRSFVPERLLAPAGALAAVAAGLGVLLLALTSKPPRVLLLLAAYAATLALAYALLIDPHEQGAMVRYFFPVFAVLVLLAASHAQLQRPWLVALLLAVHLGDLSLYLQWDRRAPPPVGYVAAAQRLAPPELAKLPRGKLVASFDSGSLGYFSDRPIVNLDGLVNHDVATLSKTCKDGHEACLNAYLRRIGVGYLVGGTAFGWTRVWPEWPAWQRAYESPILSDGARLVILALPR